MLRMVSLRSWLLIMVINLLYRSSRISSEVTKQSTYILLSPLYHPACNGKAERVVKTFYQSMKTAKGDPGTRNKKITSFLLSNRPTTTPAQLLMNRRLRTRLDLLRAGLRKKVHNQLVCSKEHQGDNWELNFLTSWPKLGLVTYRTQEGDFIWKRHIDQLKDLSETKIQLETREVTEDLLLHWPRQAQPTLGPLLAKDCPYSPPKAKDYPRSPPQTKLKSAKTHEPIPNETVPRQCQQQFLRPRNEQLNHQLNHGNFTQNVLRSHLSV